MFQICRTFNHAHILPINSRPFRDANDVVMWHWMACAVTDVTWHLVSHGIIDVCHMSHDVTDITLWMLSFAVNNMQCRWYVLIQWHHMCDITVLWHVLHDVIAVRCVTWSYWHSSHDATYIIHVSYTSYNISVTYVCQWHVTNVTWCTTSCHVMSCTWSFMSYQILRLWSPASTYIDNTFVYTST